MKRTVFYMLSFCLALSGVAQVFAHGPVTTKSQVVDTYLIEFEYDTLGELFAGTPYTYSFRLLNKDTKESVSFDAMFVRFSQKGGPLVTGVHLVPLPSEGGRISAVLADSGDYTADLDFQKGNQSIAKASFDFKASGSSTKPMGKKDAVGTSNPPNNSGGLARYGWFLGLCGGILLGTVGQRLLSHPEPTPPPRKKR